MRYLIIEVHTLYAIALRDDGSFVYVYNEHFEVGMMTDLAKEIELKRKEKERRPFRLLAPLISVMVLIMVTVGLNILLSDPLIGSIYLDINPSVRIDVARSDTVKALEGLNADGKELISDYIYEGKGVDLVLDELIDKAVSEGYLYNGGKIAIDIDGDSAFAKDVRSGLDDNITYLKEDLGVTVTIVSVNDREVIIPPIPIAPKPSYESKDYGPTPTPIVPPVVTDSPNEPDDSVYEPDDSDHDSRYEENDSNYDD